MNNHDLLKWAEDYLVENGHTISKPFEVVRETPWSKVMRCESASGWIYLKQMAPQFSGEPALIEFLHKNVTTCMPKVVATNNHCFLVYDAGDPLRDLLKTHYDTDLATHALITYAHIQRASIKHVDALNTLGVRDWRVAKLSQLYLELIKQTELLTAEGLSNTEIENLHNFYPKIYSMCAELSSYGIPETIDHGDFQDNNLLIQNNYLTINDWGDACISHPFFSMVAFLDSAKRNHGLAETDASYVYLQNTYLDIWLEFATKSELLQAFSLTKKLRYLLSALVFERVKKCQYIEKYPQYHGLIAKYLRDLLTT